MTKWEKVQNDKDRETLRLNVPGGWIYYIIEFGEMGSHMSHQAVFVPTAPREDKSQTSWQ